MPAPRARKGSPPVPSAPLPVASRTIPTTKFVRPKEAAPFIGVTEGTLRQWRHKNRGPAYYIPPGVRTVLYDLSDLRAFVTAGRVETAGAA
jgi:hypothetical protein